MPATSRLLDAPALGRVLARMASEVVERTAGTGRVVLVGIQRRGVELADRLADPDRAGAGRRRSRAAPSTSRSIATTSRPSARGPVVRETKLPPDLDGATVVIVDDVLFTGRTVRAALDEIADFGRPRRILLARAGRPRRPRAADRRRRDRAGGHHLPDERVRGIGPRARRRRRGRPGAGRRRHERRRCSARTWSASSPSRPSRSPPMLDTAEPFKEVSERPIKKVPALRGKTIVNLFFEAVDPHPDLVRVRREAAVGRHGQRAGGGLVGVARGRRWSTPRGTSRRCGSTWW